MNSQGLSGGSQKWPRPHRGNSPMTGAPPQGGVWLQAPATNQKKKEGVELGDSCAIGRWRRRCGRGLSPLRWFLEAKLHPLPPKTTRAASSSRRLHLRHRRRHAGITLSPATSTFTLDGGGGQSPAPASSVGLRADVGVAGGGLLLVVVAVQLVLHQEDEDEDEDGGHDDPPDDDDHGSSQELKEEAQSQQAHPCWRWGRSLTLTWSRMEWQRPYSASVLKETQPTSLVPVSAVTPSL